MNHIINLILDIDKENYKYVSAVQYDNGARVLKVKITSNGQSFDLTGHTVVLSAVKPDGEDIFNECKIIDQKGGIVEITMTEQMSNVIGEMKCQIVIYGLNDAVVSAKGFTMLVESSNITKNVISSSEFTALTVALSKVTNIDKKMDRGEMIRVSQIDKNQGKIDASYLSDSVLQQMAGNTPVNSTPADGSVTEPKIDSVLLTRLNKQHIKIFGGITKITNTGNDFTVTTTPMIVIWDKWGKKWSFNGVTNLKVTAQQQLIADIQTNAPNGTYELSTIADQTANVMDKVVIVGNYYGRFFSDTTLNIQEICKSITDISSKSSDNATNIDSYKHLFGTRSSMVAVPNDKPCNITFDKTSKLLKVDGQIYIRKVRGNRASFVIPSFEMYMGDNDIIFVDMEYIKTSPDSLIPIEELKKGTIWGDYDPTKHVPIFWAGHGHIGTSTGLDIEKIDSYRYLDTVRSTMVAFPYNSNVTIEFDAGTRYLKTDGSIYIRKVTEGRKSIIIPQFEFTMNNYDVIYIDPNDIDPNVSELPIEKVHKGLVFETFDPTKHLPLFWYANSQIMTSTRLKINIKGQVTPNKSYNVVCFGDSITELKTYPNKIANMTGHTVFDVSFAGAVMSFHNSDGIDYEHLGFRHLADAIYSNDFSIQEQAVENTIANGGSNKRPNLETLKSIDWNTIDKCTVFLGTNDFGASAVPLNGGEDINARTFADGMRYGIEKILSKYPHLQFYFITPIWRKNGSNPNGRGYKLTDYVSTVMEVANEYNFPVLDFYHNSGINQLNKLAFLTSDELHQNERGDVLIAEKISKFIQSN